MINLVYSGWLQLQVVEESIIPIPGYGAVFKGKSITMMS